MNQAEWLLQKVRKYNQPIEQQQQKYAKFFVPLRTTKVKTPTEQQNTRFRSKKKTPKESDLFSRSRNKINYRDKAVQHAQQRYN